MVLRLIFIAMGIGVVAEIVARILRLWLFRHWSLAVVNIVVVYGLIMGGLATQARQLGSVGMFAAAAAIGLVYEVANLRVLRLWRFPDERAVTIGGQVAVIAVLTVLWGLVPMASLQAFASLRRSELGRQEVSPLEQINQRESQLSQKLDDLHKRAKAIEDKLGALRDRKERVMLKLEGKRSVGGKRTPHEENE